MAKKIKPKSKDPYAKKQTITFELPDAFMLLCKMLQVEPKKIFMELAQDIGGKVYITKSGYLHQDATDYFVDKEFGQELYTEEHVREMIIELGFVRRLIDSFMLGQDDYYGGRGELRAKYFQAWQGRWSAKKKMKSSTK
jgi:hypothetical protein